MIRLAHLSDCHIGPLPRINPLSLLNKRITGYLNWKRHRQHIHSISVLDSLCNDLINQKLNHIAVTGDLVNLALEKEFLQAQSWLKRLGDCDMVSIVPGNHDAYVRAGSAYFIDHWASYMRGDSKGQQFQDNPSECFPYVRFLAEKIVLIGVSSAIPTPFFMATGEVGKAQLERLDVIVQRLKDSGYFTVVLIHHPPLPGQTKYKRSLLDAEEFVDVLNPLKDGLVLHGHEHKNSKFFMDTHSGQIPVVGVASASCGKQGKEPLARYNMFDIFQDNGNWQCHLIARGFDQEGGQVRQLEAGRVY